MRSQMEFTSSWQILLIHARCPGDMPLVRRKIKGDRQSPNDQKRDINVCSWQVIAYPSQPHYVNLSTFGFVKRYWLQDFAPQNILCENANYIYFRSTYCLWVVFGATELYRSFTSVQELSRFKRSARATTLSGSSRDYKIRLTGE